ncbi:uncharacterized protein LOC119729055 [Patiria miniata]|uniref:Uncharacterized protein n=1 Tax=Patiria miniata TaxID=46514 RepID=A0A914A297_PATMI|nr:uncharacterized protein LOC119729055 [Patiria miniata]
MQPAAMNQQVQMQMPTPAPSQRSRYSCAVKSLGILQIIIAGISAVLGIATGVVWLTIAVIASGVWGGLLFYLPAGILGVLSVTMAVSSRRCLAIASLVMSILSAVMAFSNIAVYGWAIATDIYLSKEYHNGHYDYRDPSAPLALDSLLVIASVLELVVSITAAVYCCFVMSEYQLNNTTTVQYVSTQATPQVMVYNQPAAVPYTPAGAPGMFVTNQAPVQQQAFGASAAGAQDMEKDTMNFT